MTEQQLYFAIGVPLVAILVGILTNVTMVVTSNNRVNHLESRLDTRIDRLESKMDHRFDKIDTQLASIIAKFDILIGKVIEVDNRLTRLEERLKIA